MSNNKQSMKLYTEEQVNKIAMQIKDYGYWNHSEITPIELLSDEEIESKYNKFIDAEIQLGFLKQEQGERLKWYYKSYFIDKIQGGNNEQQ